MTGSVASVLKSKNLDVEVVDANLYRWSFYKTVQELKKKSIKLLGVHLVYLWDKTEDVFEMFKELRREGVNAHINLYGHFPTFAFEEILSGYSFVDSITIGEPEYTFLELAEAVTNSNGNSSLHSIDGLAFNFTSNEKSYKFPSENPTNPPLPPLLKGDLGGLSSSFIPLSEYDNINKNVFKPEIIKNKPRKPIPNLDDIPFPYRPCFEILKARGIATYILASRGCYGKCTFCYLNQFYSEEPLWRGRRPENIIDEICHIYEKYDERYFYFADANFFGPGRQGKVRACKLAHMIMDRGLKMNFGIECRVNDVEEKTIGLLVKAGLREVFLGVESGSQDSLDRFRKFTTIEENKKAINILRQFGIEPNYGFILFGPDSTLKEVRENFEFLNEMKMLRSPSITAHLMHHRQTIFKGTPDYENRRNSAKSVCRFNYEYVCNFRDERVGELAENIKSFCYETLYNLSGNEDLKKDHTSCSYDEDDSFSKKLNQKLIEHFEGALYSLETK